MKKLFAAVLALALFLLSACPALAEKDSPAGDVARLMESVHTLLFGTNNVTLRGEAVFSLGGKRFKTAEILYKQAGEDSRWQLELKTPRLYRRDQETGFIIIANGEKIYVMEKYYPGTYTSGSDRPCTTVISRSTRSELLYAMLLSIAGEIESLLPEGAVVYPETEEACRLMEISLTKETTPELLNTSLNLAADFFLRRFMGVNYDYVRKEDRGRVQDYITVTQAVLYTTDSFVLGDSSVSFMTDLNGRFEAVSGTVTALLSSEEYHEEPLEVSFSLTASDYGATVVETFDPEDFGVVPKESYEGSDGVDPVLEEKMTARAKEILEAAGYETASRTLAYVNEGSGYVYVSFPTEVQYASISVGMNEEGDLLTFADASVDYTTDHPGFPEDSLPDEAVELLDGFLKTGFPDLAARRSGFWQGIRYSGGDSVWQVVDAEPGIFFLVQLEPELKIIQYTCMNE